MDRTLFPGARTFEANDLVELTGKIVIASNGAVTSNNIKGVDTVARTAEGKYKVSLKDTYAGGLKSISLSVGGAWYSNLENDSSTDTSDPHLDIYTRAIADGAASDADSQTIYLTALLQRRS
jgi:hypothetical protein